jgi:biopolymer transport protein TolR
MAFRIGDSDEPVMADINVTPLVDVMLVLLIIFMITAPMLHQGIDVALPRADAANLPAQDEEPLILTINRDGLVYLREQPIHPSQLVDRLLPLLEARQDRFVYLQGDEQVAYGRVVELLDLLQRGGIQDVGLVTEPPSSRRGRRGR